MWVSGPFGSDRPMLHGAASYEVPHGHLYIGNICVSRRPPDSRRTKELLDGITLKCSMLFLTLAGLMLPKQAWWRLYGFRDARFSSNPKFWDSRDSVRVKGQNPATKHQNPCAWGRVQYGRTGRVPAKNKKIGAYLRQDSKDSLLATTWTQ